METTKKETGTGETTRPEENKPKESRPFPWEKVAREYEEYLMEIGVRF